MANEEPNNYLAALEDAITVIDEQRELVIGESGMAQPIVTKIATDDGWVCDQADEWIAELTERCGPVAREFETARDEIQAEVNRQSAWPDVPQDDWRGIRYHQPVYTNPGMY